MENDPELNGKYLGTITRDFALVSDTLKEAAYLMRQREISNFPIFIFSRQNLPVGALLIGAEEMALQWNVLASYLADFVQRGIIEEDKILDFQQAYRNPDEFCCLFVVDEEFTKFVFLPYPED